MNGPVVVTGASRGIGRAISLRLAGDGYDVCLVFARESEKTDAVAESIKAMSRKAWSYRADFSSPGETDDLVRRLVREHGTFHGLVNNAGIYLRKPASDVSLEDWNETLQVNLTAPFQLTKGLAPFIGPGGSVVNVSSVLGRTGSTRGVHYTASKAGLIGLTKAFARELAPNIRVNCVAPGAIDTDIISGDTEEERRRREESIPLGSVGEPEEIAGVVSFLISPDSSFITGAVIDANGGYLM